MAKGYSLDDLQEMTKIQKRYLVGIEEGDYSSMPGSFYVRAFIKQYADAVGLNANEVLEQYQQDIPSTPQTEVAQSFSQSHNRRKLAKTTSSSKMMESIPKLIVALFIIVIIIVSIALISKKMSQVPSVVDEDDVPVEYDKKPVTADPEVEEEETEEEETEVVEPVATQAISEGVALSDGKSFEYTVTGAEALNIRVEVLQNESWVGLRDTNGTELLGTNNTRVYKAGEKVEFDATGNDYIRIRLGSAPSVKVYVNDEEITYVSDIETQNIIIKTEQVAQ